MKHVATQPIRAAQDSTMLATENQSMKHHSVLGVGDIQRSERLLLLLPRLYSAGVPTHLTLHIFCALRFFSHSYRRFFRPLGVSGVPVDYFPTSALTRSQGRFCGFFA